MHLISFRWENGKREGKGKKKETQKKDSFNVLQTESVITLESGISDAVEGSKPQLEHG